MHHVGVARAESLKGTRITELDMWLHLEHSMHHIPCFSDHSGSFQVKERIQRDMLQARLRGFGKTLLFNENQVFHH